MWVAFVVHIVFLLDKAIYNITKINKGILCSWTSYFCNGGQMSLNKVGLRHSCKTIEDIRHLCVLRVAQNCLRASLCSQEESVLHGLGFRVE